MGAEGVAGLLWAMALGWLLGLTLGSFQGLN